MEEGMAFSRLTVGQSQLNVSFIRVPVVMVDLHSDRNPKTASKMLDG